MQNHSDLDSGAGVGVGVETYIKGWVRVDLMVSPDGQMHAIGGDRAPGDPLSDLPYIGLERIKAATEQATTDSVMGMTIEEAELLDTTIEQFCDCGETDTPYEKLLDWANRGYLECERFLALPAAQDAIDAARLAKAQGGAA